MFIHLKDHPNKVPLIDYNFFVKTMQILRTCVLERFKTSRLRQCLDMPVKIEDETLIFSEKSMYFILSPRISTNFIKCLSSIFVLEKFKCNC